MKLVTPCLSLLTLKLPPPPVRPVKVYDTYSDNTTKLQVSVYLLDLPLTMRVNKHESETGMIDVVPRARMLASED